VRLLQSALFAALFAIALTFAPPAATVASAQEIPCEDVCEGEGEEETCVPHGPHPHCFQCDSYWTWTIFPFGYWTRLYDGYYHTRSCPNGPTGNPVDGLGGYECGQCPGAP